MSSQNVELKLGLDTSGAEASLNQFFSKFDKAKPQDPFKGVNASFDAFEKKAKQLGLTWDATANKFKDGLGNPQSIKSVQQAINAVDKAAKDSGTSFGVAAKGFRDFESAAKAGAQSVGTFGQSAQNAGSSIKGLQLGTLSNQLKQMGTDSNTAGTGLKGLGTSATTTAGQLKGIGQGAESGIKKIGTESKTADGALKGLGTSAGNTAGDLKNVSKTGSLKPIGDSANNASTGITNLGNAAKTTGTQVKSVSDSGKNLTQIGQAAQNAGQQMNTAAQSTGRMAQSIKGVTQEQPKLANFAHSIGQAGTAANTSSISVGKLGTALQQSSQKAQKLTAVPNQIKNIPPAFLAAEKAALGMGKEFDNASKKGETMGSKIKQSFQQIVNGIPAGIGLAIGNALIAPLKELANVIPKAVSEFKALDQSLRLTLEISGAGAAKFGELKDSILAVSSISASTASDVAAVAQSLAKAGFSLTEIDAALQPIIQGAEATGTSYETMGDIVASALGGFSLEAKDAADVADTLVVAANNSNQSVSDLGEALKYVAPVANTVGQEITDVALALELLANNGIRGSQAGTSFRTILTNLQIAASGAGDEFLELSRGAGRLSKTLQLIGADVTDTNGELLKGKDLIYALQNAMSGLSTGEKAIISKSLAGAEGLPALNALINASTDDIESLADALDNRAGAAADQAGKAMAGLAGSVKILESNISAALVAIGEVIAVALTPLVQGVTAVIAAFNALPGPVKAVVIALGLIGTAAAAVVTAIKVIGTATIASLGGQALTAIQSFAKAMTMANVQTAIAGMVNNIKALGTAITVNLTSVLAGAAQGLTKFYQALASGEALTGFINGITAISNGLKGIPAAQAAVQLSLFSTASTGAGTAGVAGAAGIAATGTASAAATPAVAALGASLGAFLIAIAPIALAIGALVGVMAYLNDRNQVAKDSVDSLNGSMDTLNKSMEKQKSTADTYTGDTMSKMVGGYTSWGKALADMMGPFDRLLNVVLPGVWPLIKLAAEALGKLNEWDRTRVAIDSVTQASNQFKQAMSDSNAQIAANRAELQNLIPGSERYGELVDENKKLIDAQVQATKERIKGLQDEIAEQEKSEQPNQRLIDLYKDQIAELENQLPLREANQKLLADERQAHVDAGGAVDDYTDALQRLNEERSKATSDAAEKELRAEITLRSKAGEALRRHGAGEAALAKVKLESINARIAADEKYLQEAETLYNQGKISQQEFEDIYKEVTKGVQDTLKDRFTAEQELTQKVAESIASRLAEYKAEVDTIADNIGKIQDMMGELNGLGSSAIDAFKGLAQAVADYQTTMIDKQEERALKGIENRKKAELAAIDASAASSSAKQRQKEAVERKYQGQKEAAERKFEAERKRVAEDLWKTEKTALELKHTMQKAELELWVAKEKIANKMAQIQVNINKAEAEAKGASDEQLKLYDDQLRILGEQEKFIDRAAKIKGTILQVEKDTADQILNTKAAAEGLNVQHGGQLKSLGQIRTEMKNVVSDIEAWQGGYQQILDEIGPIEDKTKEVAEGAVKAIDDAFDAFDTTDIQAELAGIFGPTTAKLWADDMIGGIDQASILAAEAGKNNLLALGEAIPKQLIKDQLIAAIQEGAGLSLKKATEVYNKMDETLPTKQIAAILGNAFGDGALDGYEQLRNTPLPEGVFKPLGTDLKQSIGTATQEMATEQPPLWLNAAKLGAQAFTGQWLSAINTMGDMFYGAGEQGGKDMADGVAQGAEAAGPTIADKWGAIATASGQAFVGNWGAAGNELIKVMGTDGELGGEALLKGIEYSINPLGALFNDATKVIVSSFGNAGKEGGQDMKQNLDDVMLDAGIDAAANFGAQFIPGLGPVMQVATGEFEKWGIDTGLVFGRENVNAIQGAYEGLKGFVKGFFTTGDFNTAMKQAGEAQAKAMGEGLKDVELFADKTAKNVGDAFKDVIPKELVKEDIISALWDGSVDGLKAAEEEYNKLPTFIPREDISQVLGEAVGGGVKEGEEQLKLIKIPPEVQRQMQEDTKQGLKEGGKEGAKEVTTQLKAEGDAIGSAMGSAMAKGAKNGMEEVVKLTKSAGEDIAENLGAGGQKFAENLYKALDKAIKDAEKALNDFGKSFKAEHIGKQLKTELTTPIENAATALGELKVAEGLADDMGAAATAAKEIKSSGMSGELRNSSTQARGLQSAMSRARSSISGAVGPANSLANALQRAASASARIKSSKWTGGPVQGGQRYTVNELGREMFMSKSGQISEIKKPAFGSWVAPSSGTVIPASISAMIRSGQDAGTAAQAVSALSGRSSGVSAPSGRGGYERKLLREIGKIGNSGGGNITNNVQITSDRPVNDASQMLVQMARLRNTRRR